MGLRGPKPTRKEVVWSADLAYGIGLMASDGCLSSDGRHLVFVSKDKQQVENIRVCFSIKAKTTEKKNYREPQKPYYQVQWGDVVLYRFLMRIGLTPNKSLTIGALYIPDEYFFDFLRGSYDGDGCFYSYFDPRWKNSFMYYLTFTSASLDHILWIRDTVKRLCLVEGHITRTGKDGKTPMTSLKFAKRETNVLLHKLYALSTGISLNRKRLKIAEALSIVNESLPESVKI